MTKRKGPTKDQIIKAYINEIIRLTEWVNSLQKQLNEANEVIVCCSAMPTFPVNVELCRNYLEKWGVK